MASRSDRSRVIDLDAWRRGRMSLWPGRPKPRTDELLSSWVRRIADYNGLSFEAFMETMLPTYPATQFDDFDFLAGEEHFNCLSAGTGVAIDDVRALSLRACQSAFSTRTAGQSGQDWIIPRQLGAHSRGWQWCPDCVAEFPHIKRVWRLAFVAVCPMHRRKLLDRCDECRRALQQMGAEPLRPDEAAIPGF